jgi:hypothetical protein
VDGVSDSYDDKLPATNRRPEDASRTETFDTEPEALIRARELIEDGDCYAVAISDDSGEVLGGIRLQLKLGLSSDSQIGTQL